MSNLIRLTGVIFLCILILNSCKKDNDSKPSDIYHYTGILIDRATRNPVPNHKIYLRKLDFSSFYPWELSYADTTLILPNLPKGAVDSTFTSPTGTFTFSYPPQVPSGELLNYYWPTLGNQDNIFCYTFVFFRLGPQPIIDTFFTEPPRTLSITMHKSAAAHPSDLTFQHVSLFNPNGIFISKIYFKGQAGITNHTVELPYSEHFADRAIIKWNYRGNLPGQVGEDTVALQPSVNTQHIINY